MIVDVADLLGTLRLEPTGDGRFSARNLATGGTVFGGQIMAQAIIAGSATLGGHDGSGDQLPKTVQLAKTVQLVKTVQLAKTLHTVFARPARADEPIAIEVEPVHAGRSFSSATITVTQANKVCARSMLLCSADEPDFVTHAATMPAVGDPPAIDAGSQWQVDVVGDVDVDDPDAVGPPELDVWSRFPGAPRDPVMDQAMLAFASDGFLIGTAMRPHAGVGQSQAHVSVATGVVSHTLTFHRRAPASDWLLLAHRSPFAGAGRCYGRADVFDRSGALVASFVQDGLLRPAG